MQNIRIIEGTPKNFHQYSMCGYKDINNQGYAEKISWNKTHFTKGLRYNFLLDEKGQAVGGIEFQPAESSLRPIHAPNYLIINCLYIMKKAYKGQGFGQGMLKSCIQYAIENKYDGVAAIVRKGSWMANNSLFYKFDFKSSVKIKNGYELVYLKLKDEAQVPFIEIENIPQEYTNGLFIFYSCQCPYTNKAIEDIKEIALKDFNLDPNVINLDINNIPRFSTFGTFHIVHDGELVAFHPISGTRFRNIMKKRI